MTLIKAILIGYGQIGRAIYEVFGKHHDLDVYDIMFKVKPQGTYDILLVAIPYSDRFVEIVNAYREEYGVQATIVFSTVAIGTTSRIPDVVHSPVEGRHPNLTESMMLFQRWVGGYHESAHQFLIEAGFRPTYLARPEFTEFLKLQSTSNYGVCIEYARYVKSVCDDLGMDYEAVKQFNRDYNDLYLDLDLPQFQRYILDPPIGPIGGTCVRPNARILDNQYPHIFLKEIYERWL